MLIKALRGASFFLFSLSSGYQLFKQWPKVCLVKCPYPKRIMGSCKQCCDPLSSGNRAVKEEGNEGVLGICSGFTHIQFQLSSPRSVWETFTHQCLKQGVCHPASVGSAAFSGPGRGKPGISNTGSNLNSSMRAMGFHLMSWEAREDSWLLCHPLRKMRADIPYLRGPPRHTYTHMHVYVRARCRMHQGRSMCFPSHG